MSVTGNESSTYETDLKTWRDSLDERLRSEEGWLSLAGLYWLHEGENTVGSDPASEITLPPDSTPQHLGTVSFQNGVATLHVTCDEPVTVDGTALRSAVLRDDHDPNGPSLVTIRAITFHIIKREDQYGVRVRDQNNPARQTFTGRKWYPINPDYHVQAHFSPHATPRSLSVVNSVGILVPMENPGSVEFDLRDQHLRLEAFTADEGELWFIFKDKTNGASTYGAGRFLTAPVFPDGSVDLDFNRTYNPPCAFTPYATCPLPPRENILPVEIAAGERV